MQKDMRIQSYIFAFHNKHAGLQEDVLPKGQVYGKLLQQPETTVADAVCDH
jgi:hypothetical protein